MGDKKTEVDHYDVVLEDVETDFKPRKVVKSEKSEKQTGWQYASVAGQIGFDIALPMVLGLVVGTKLDERWGTRPTATLSLFVIGLLLSCASLIRIVRDASGKR